MILAVAVAVVLMASIGLWGYLTLQVWRWPEPVAAPAIIAFHVALAAVLIRWLFPGRGQPRRMDAARPQPTYARPASPYQLQQQAYRDNPEARLACEHLRPVEDGMRKAGVRVEYASESSLYARCHFRAAAMLLPAPVRYVEDWSGREPDAHLWCDACRYSIFVLHPAEGGTATFPSEGTA